MKNWQYRQLTLFSACLFLLVGSVFIGVSYFSLNSFLKFSENAVPTTGVVTKMISDTDSDGDTYYVATIEYNTSSSSTEIITKRLTSNTNIPQKNESIQILYNESNTNEARINSFEETYLGPIIFGFIGSISFLVGFGFLINMIKKAKNDRWLEDNGRVVTAKFISLEKANVAINGVKRDIAVYKWTDPQSGAEYVFNSDYLYHADITEYQGKTANVLINPDNPKIYKIKDSNHTS